MTWLQLIFNPSTEGPSVCRPPAHGTNRSSNVRPLTLAAALTLLPPLVVAADTGPAGDWDCAGQPGKPDGWDCRAGSPPVADAPMAPATATPVEPAAAKPPTVTAESPPTPTATAAPAAAEPAPQPQTARTAPAAGPMQVPPPPRIPLPMPEPLPPIPPVVDTSRQDFSGPTPWVLPPGDRATPGADTPSVNAALGPLPGSVERLDDARLYADPPWDFCGPRVGLTGLGGSALPPADTQTPIDATADKADYDRSNDVVRLRGNVEILQAEQRLEAGHTLYNRQSGQVDAAGNLYLEYPGGRLAADEGHYNLQTKTGAMDRVRYRMSKNANLRGTAETAELLPGQITRYRDVTYTTCPPGRSDWSLRASELELDHNEGLGTARHARVRLADIPVFYTPYLRFPIDDRRRSGVLVPTVGTSNTNGIDITIPYYWNIAPNMDATLFPRYMSNRGLMVGAQVRHLSTIQSIDFNGEILPADEKEPQYGSRGAVRLKETGWLTHGWSSSIDASWVSDDQYLEDFGNRLDVTSLRNLDQRADLTYSGKGFWTVARLQDFQTVDPTIPPADRPYSQLPHLEFNIPTTRRGPFEYGFQAHYDYFDHTDKVHGSREVLLPSLSLPVRRSYGYFMPRARVFYTGYTLTDTAPGQASDQSFFIPSLDVDSKLIFDRDTRWLGQDALQTLEPRLYYVLTPYENQSDTPLFDTTALTFSYASLFRPNRFTGYDRIGDENRLTFGLTSRTIGNRSGREWLRASLGQIFFFDPRRVQLSSAMQVDESSTSAIAGELATNPLLGFTARASFQWDPNVSQNQWEQRVLQLRYAPGDDRVVNLAYRYNLAQSSIDGYENTDVSFRLPITPQIGVVGRWLYSLLDEDTVDAYAGIEFGRCCWRLRLLARQLKTSETNPANTSVMLQLELRGLGAVGNQIDKFLEQGIDGYAAD